MADAADAHLILFGLKKIQQLPDALYEWLERWVALRQVQESALAVWVDGEVLSPEAVAVAPLSHFAKRYGLSFIHEAAGSINAKSSAFARRDALLSTQHVMGSIFYHKQGINE